jgi:NAD+ kinase
LRVSLVRIAVVVHPTRDVHGAMGALKEWAEAHGVEVVQLGGPSHAPAGTIDGASLILAVGGDGTVLGALRAAAPSSLPVLGVACGSLGALTTVAADDLPEALDRFAAGDWTAHRIPALEIQPETGDAATALNDLVIVRAGGSQVTVSLIVDGVLYGRFAGDGVIVSTQLGSSAYSMAAGGPVLAPASNAWLVTPLAPHGGCLPPVVLGRDSRLLLKVEPGFAGARVEIDGRPAEIESGPYDITLRQDIATLVRLGDEEEYFTGLRRRRILMDSPRVMARDDRSSFRPV